MNDHKVLPYIKEVLQNMPKGWLTTTTHRLDIYNEALAKTEFLDQLEDLYRQSNATEVALKQLPTAYDYIRLGHPLSCVLEWGIAKISDLTAENVISFSSQMVPVLAVLRKNLFENKNTQILYVGTLPQFFDAELVRSIYGYCFELKQVASSEQLPAFDGSTVFI